MIYIWYIKKNATYSRKSRNFKNKIFIHRIFKQEWLREMVDLSNHAYQGKITANLIMRTEKDAVEIKVRTRHLRYHSYAWEWQRKTYIRIT